MFIVLLSYLSTYQCNGCHTSSMWHLLSLLCMQGSPPRAAQPGGSYNLPSCAFRDLGKYINLQTKRQWLHFHLDL